MNRREVITALAFPFLSRGAWAQPTVKRKIGFLGANTPAAAGHLTDAFVKRLNELGWMEGGNVVIEYRWAAGETARFRELAAELVALKVDVIVTSGTAPARAAQDVTKTIPIVLAASSGILASGLIDSLGRPGRNVTGLTVAPEDTIPKRLELLKEIFPALRRVAVLYNPDANPEQVVAAKQAAPLMGIECDVFDFRSLNDLGNITMSTRRPDIDALMVVSDPLVFVHRKAINAFALRERLPTMHGLREYVDDGGLISYGPHFPDFFRRAADFVDKIFKGGKPEELPIERPTLYRLVISVRTATTLGLKIPEAFLARADEVIE